jgi:hypothetical protein
MFYVTKIFGKFTLLQTNCMAACNNVPLYTESWTRLNVMTGMNILGRYKVVLLYPKGINVMVNSEEITDTTEYCTP